MKLAGLIQHVREHTGLADAEILEIVRVAWPTLYEFTETQAALVVNSVLRRRRAPDPGAINYTIWPAERQEPRTITDEQLWGKK